MQYHARFHVSFDAICRPNKQMSYALLILEDSIDVWKFLISMFIYFQTQNVKGNAIAIWKAGGQCSAHPKNIIVHQNGGL